MELLGSGMFVSGRVKATLASSPGKPSAQFVSGHTLACVTTALLSAGILIHLISIALGYSEAQHLLRLSPSQMVDGTAATDASLGQSMLSLAQLAVYLATAIVFLVWIHRAYRNLTALGVRNPRFSPGWAVGWFFVPFMSLFRPYEVVKELWNKSAPLLPDGGPAPEDKRMVGIWWALFLIANFAWRIAGDFDKAEVARNVLSASWTNLASHALSLALCIAALVLVRGIDQRQRERSEQVQNA